MNKDRLLKLAEFLEGLDSKDFFFGNWVKERDNDCGTVCCAIGWLPRLFPDDWEWTGEGRILSPALKISKGESWNTPSDDAESFFEIDEDEGAHLFHPGLQSRRFGKRLLVDGSRPKTVAANIREFIARKEASK